MEAHDEEAGLGEPCLVIGGLALLSRPLSAMRREDGPQLGPGRLRPLEEERQHRHEVRLAAAEAAVNEAPVLLAAVEDLLHVVEDARQLPLDRGPFFVVRPPEDEAGPVVDPAAIILRVHHAPALLLAAAGQPFFLPAELLDGLTADRVELPADLVLQPVCQQRA